MVGGTSARSGTRGTTENLPFCIFDMPRVEDAMPDDLMLDYLDELMQRTAISITGLTKQPLRSRSDVILSLPTIALSRIQSPIKSTELTSRMPSLLDFSQDDQACDRFTEVIRCKSCSVLRHTGVLLHVTYVR